MVSSNTRVGVGLEPPEEVAVPRTPEPEYALTFMEEPGLLVSVSRQLVEFFREPKKTIPAKYFHGEVSLPISDMRPWYRDIGKQIRVFLEKPADPIGLYNDQQTRKRALFALAVGLAGAGVGWALHRELVAILAAVGGLALGELTAAWLFKKRAYPPDIWRDYEPQGASWLNSVLVHIVAVAVLVVPFVIDRMLHPVKAATKTEIVDISPYLAQIEGPDSRTGGGGGGGDRSPTPASKGAVPKFAKTQLAPPMAVLPNLDPKLPVQPTLVGPPELKLPQMAMNGPWGDPQGVLGPASNGPGFGGGIGSGEGTGIGSGRGGGLGPGEGGGFGGGAFSVGGSVTAPVPIYQPTPAYSEEARKAKHQGSVVVYIVVDSQGNVTDARVVKPLGLGLDEKALDAVRTWKFKPGTKNGVAVPVKVMIEVLFRLF